MQGNQDNKPDDNKIAQQTRYEKDRPSSLRDSLLSRLSNSPRFKMQDFNSRVNKVSRMFKEMLSAELGGNELQMIVVDRHSPEYIEHRLALSAIVLVNRSEAKAPRYYFLWLMEENTPPYDLTLKRRLEDQNFAHHFMEMHYVGESKDDRRSQVYQHLVVPADVDFNEETVINILNHAAVLLYANIDKNGDIETTDLREYTSRDMRFSLNYCFGQRNDEVTDVFNHPIRSDIILQAWAVEAYQRRSAVESRPIPLVTVCGYIDYVLVSGSTPTHPWILPKTELKPMFVVTGVKTEESVLLAEATPMAIAMANSFMETGDWVQVYEQQSEHSTLLLNATNKFFAARGVNGFKKFPPDTADELNHLFRYTLAEALAPGFLIGLDIPHNPTQSQLYRISGDVPLYERIQRWFEAAGKINGSEKRYDHRESGYIHNAHTGIAIGYYDGVSGRKVDIRRLDPIAVADATDDQQLANAMADSYLTINSPAGTTMPASTYVEQSIEERKKFVLSAIDCFKSPEPQKVTYTGMAERVVLTPAIAKEIADMFSYNGFSFRSKLDKGRPALWID